MKLKLNTMALERELLSIGDQFVRVGVLQKGKPSKRPARPLKRLQLTVGVQRNAVDRRRNPRAAKLEEVAAYLNQQRGLFDEALAKAGNKELNQIAQYFADLVLDPGAAASTKQRLENACRSIVRNPMLRKEYGENAESTAKAKGFNHWGVNTGTLFKAIEAKYGRH